MKHRMLSVAVVLVVAFVATSAFGRPDAKETARRVAIAMKAANAHVLPRAVTGIQRKDLKALVGLLRAGETKLGQEAWEKFAKHYLTQGVAADIDSIANWVLRESCLETNKNLQGRIDKVRYYNELTSALRTCVGNSRTQLRLSESAKTVRIYKLQIRPYKLRAGAIAKKYPETMTREAAERYLAQLKKQLASADNDSSMAQLSLQDVMQMQQQALQMLSNIQKMLHDTTMAIIRKLR